MVHRITRFESQKQVAQNFVIAREKLHVARDQRRIST